MKERAAFFISSKYSLYVQVCVIPPFSLLQDVLKYIIMQFSTNSQ